MAINDGTTVPLSGFSGTIVGLIQQTAEETNGARKIERVTGESNETAAVVITGPYKDVSISATVLTTFALALRMSTPFAYNSVNYRTTAKSDSKSPTLSRLNLTGRKEDSMTYTLPA